MKITISDSRRYMNRPNPEKNDNSLKLSRISYVDLIKILTERGINIDKEKSEIKMKDYTCSTTLKAQTKPHAYHIVTNNLTLDIEKFRKSTVTDLSVNHQKGIKFSYKSNQMTNQHQLTPLITDIKRIENVVDQIYNPLWDLIIR